MLVKDPEVMRLIERLREHYRANIANRYIRPALLVLPLDRQAWERIDSLTENTEDVNTQNFHLDELYQQLAIFAQFISLSKHELSPMLRIRLGLLDQKHNDERVLREMAINNFGSNLRVLADLLNELFVRLVALDKAAARTKPPLYQRIPELAEVGRQLVG